MEITVKSIAVSIVMVTVLTWIWRVVNWVWLRPKRMEKYLRQQGLSGNSYRFLYGDLKENSIMLKQAKSNPINLTDDISPHLFPFLHKAIHNYCKNCFTWAGPIPRVTIMKPDQIKDIFNKINDFQKVTLAKILGCGLACYDGDKWAKHRKIINPAFHNCNEMISKWDKLMCKDGSCELDAWPFLVILTSDLLQTKTNKRTKEINKEIQASFMSIIKNREIAMKVGETAKDDLLGILMESNLREIEEHGVGITIQDVIEECKLFYFAGAETTSVLLVWTMILLSHHQDWQARAREEVFQVFGNQKPDFDGLNHLRVVQMIFNEVMRLYPPLIVLDREDPKETKLGNLSLPAGVQVSLPILLVHHDHELWGDNAMEFKPERSVGAKGENVDIDRPKAILGHAVVVTLAIESIPMEGVSVDPSPITYFVKKWKKVARNGQALFPSSPIQKRFLARRKNKNCSRSLGERSPIVKVPASVPPDVGSKRKSDDLSMVNNEDLLIY
ncbi:hypothetical protein ACOSQ4_031532 [Xanthoceras sorbifolium]